MYGVETITIVQILIFAVVGTWALVKLFSFIEAYKELRARKQAMESELRVTEDAFHVELQRFSKANAACPVFMPAWAEIRVEQQRSEIANRLLYVESDILDMRQALRDDDRSSFSDARKHAEHHLAEAHRIIHELFGIERWVVAFRQDATYKANEALQFMDEVLELWQTASDRSSAPDLGKLLNQKLSLRAVIASNNEGMIDQSDEVLRLAEQLIIDAGRFKYSLEHPEGGQLAEVSPSDCMGDCFSGPRGGGGAGISC